MKHLFLNENRTFRNYNTTIIIKKFCLFKRSNRILDTKTINVFFFLCVENFSLKFIGKKIKQSNCNNYLSKRNRFYLFFEMRNKI